VTDPKSAGLSYGHNVEFAWLMIRAQKVLGQSPAWSHFYAHLDHALKYGYDWNRGGLYYRGEDDQPASTTDKVWWAEAELIAALSDGLAHRYNPTYAAALETQIHFLEQHQINPADGIWFDTVKADGSPKSGGKAHSWKANYHDVRAIVKFVEAFPPKK
jgi:mannobiose 2-epimerase